jgi:hypothetical protein
MFKNKYIKYKKKYFDLKGAGFIKRVKTTSDKKIAKIKELIELFSTDTNDVSSCIYKYNEIFYKDPSNEEEQGEQIWILTANTIDAGLFDEYIWKEITISILQDELDIILCYNKKDKTGEMLELIEQLKSRYIREDLEHLIEKYNALMTDIQGNNKLRLTMGQYENYVLVQIMISILQNEYDIIVNKLKENRLKLKRMCINMAPESGNNNDGFNEFIDEYNKLLKSVSLELDSKDPVYFIRLEKTRDVALELVKQINSVTCTHKDLNLKSFQFKLEEIKTHLEWLISLIKDNNDETDDDEKTDYYTSYIIVAHEFMAKYNHFLYKYSDFLVSKKFIISDNALNLTYLEEIKQELDTYNYLKYKKKYIDLQRGGLMAPIHISKENMAIIKDLKTSFESIKTDTDMTDCIVKYNSMNNMFYTLPQNNKIIISRPTYTDNPDEIADKKLWLANMISILQDEYDIMLCDVEKEKIDKILPLIEKLKNIDTSDDIEQLIAEYNDIIKTIHGHDKFILTKEQYSRYVLIHNMISILQEEYDIIVNKLKEQRLGIKRMYINIIQDKKRSNELFFALVDEYNKFLNSVSLEIYYSEPASFVQVKRLGYELQDLIENKRILKMILENINLLTCSQKDFNYAFFKIKLIQMLEELRLLMALIYNLNDNFKKRIRYEPTLLKHEIIESFTQFYAFLDQYNNFRHKYAVFLVISNSDSKTLPKFIIDRQSKILDLYTIEDEYAKKLKTIKDFLDEIEEPLNDINEYHNVNKI